MAINLPVTLRKLDIALDGLTKNSQRLDSIFKKLQKTPDILNMTLRNANGKIDVLAASFTDVSANLNNTLTATPIPRTLHFSLMGARDLSIIATPPPNRQPVTTELHTYHEEIIRDAVSHEIRRGGQVFFVHNRVSDIESIANVIYKLVPDARIGIAHGQMEGDKLEKVMMRFIEGEYDVLVSTNIIESGLDIPNANTIIINQAHMFGLSDLHQMRGRVGRSNKKAFCYLLTPPASVLTADSRKRLSALEEFSELGDGFKVAMRDLDIRGAGNLLGAEQSGFINDLGFDTYHKILDDAIQELKENEFKDLFAEELSEKAKLIAADCTIETDLEILIPENYVSSTRERLQLYSTLDNIHDEEGLLQFETVANAACPHLAETVTRNHLNSVVSLPFFNVLSHSNLNNRIASYREPFGVRLLRVAGPDLF